MRKRQPISADAAKLLGRAMPAEYVDQPCGWKLDTFYDPIHYDCNQCKRIIIGELKRRYKQAKVEEHEQPRLPIMDEWKNEG